MSMGLHLSFILFMVFGRCDHQTWVPQQTVYQVELVSPVNAASGKTLRHEPVAAEPERVIEPVEQSEKPETEIKPEPAPEIPVEMTPREPRKKVVEKKIPAQSQTGPPPC